MIYGVGTDILRVVRIRDARARFGERFAERILMEVELAHYRISKNPVRFLAMRFAGKEAVVKALGTGFAHGIWLRDVGVVADKRGKPEVIFSERGRQLCEREGIADAHVSLSDEGDFVIAFAVLSTAPRHRV